MEILLLAFSNLRRSKLRTALTILAAAIALIAFVVLRTVVSAFNVYASNAAKDRIVTRHRLGMSIFLPVRYSEAIASIDGITRVTYGHFQRGHDPRKPNRSFASLAVAPDSFLEVVDEIVVSDEVRQRWLTERSAALLGDKLAEALGVAPGERITLKTAESQHELQIVGTYEVSRPTFGRWWLLFHYDFYNAEAPETRKDKVNRFVSRVDDPTRAAQVAEAIQQALARQAEPTVTESEELQANSALAGYAVILTAVDVGSIGILLFLLLILGNTIAMGVRERTVEYAVLRALGFRRGHIYAAVVLEGFFLGALAGAIGLAASYGVTDVLLARWLERTAIVPYFQADAAVWGAAIAAAIGTSVLSSLLPAHMTFRLSIIAALRHVE